MLILLLTIIKHKSYRKIRRNEKSSTRKNTKYRKRM